MNFLIQYHRKTGSLRLQEYSEIREAMERRLELEQRNDDPEMEIVVVSADTLNELKSNHARYFGLEVVDGEGLSAKSDDERRKAG